MLRPADIAGVACERAFRALFGLAILAAVFLVAEGLILLARAPRGADPRAGSG